jgi:hypothetical protein
MAATARPAPARPGLRRKVADDLGADGQDQRPGQLGDLASHDLVIMTVARRMVGLRFAAGDWLRVETGLSHGRQRWRDRRLVGIDREHPLAQLESQTANAGHAIKGTPDLGLLGRAVHRRDPETAPPRRWVAALQRRRGHSAGATTVVRARGFLQLRRSVNVPSSWACA